MQSCLKRTLTAAILLCGWTHPSASAQKHPDFKGKIETLDSEPESERYAEAQRHFERGGELFEEALRYKEKNPTEKAKAARRFREAAREYVAAWKKGIVTTEIFTNAAKSFFFAGDKGEAVLYYRRALAVDPGNASARDDLQVIRQSLPIRRRQTTLTTLSGALFFWHDERSFLWRLWGFYILFPAAWILFTVELARHRWKWIQILLVPVFPLALLALALSYLFRIRRPFLIIGVISLLPALLVLGSLAVDAWSYVPGREAVVLVETRGRTGDGTAYSASHSRPFPPGTEVTILARREDPSASWLRIRLRDGSKSWIRDNVVETIEAP
jgi:hypothetical protein